MDKQAVSLVLIGLNYQTAPVEYREQFYLAGESLSSALQTLRGEGLAEVIILSTCNRLEIISHTNQPDTALLTLKNFLAHSRHIAVEQLSPYFYPLRGRAVIEHLMRVACGLESLVLGESQILGQVADVLASAQSIETSNTMLTRLFTSAVHVGKRARSETTISRYTLSVSHAAILLVGQHITDFSSVRALVVGAGEMAELAARALQMHGVTDLTIVNRTFANAAELAQTLGTKVVVWDNLPQSLPEVDVVIAAHPIIKPEHFQLLGQGRMEHSILLVDIGMPRNIDPAIRELSSCHLCDIDDLQTVVAEHHSRRQAEITQVEAIVSEELEAFWKWLHTRQIVPLIAELRSQAETLADLEVEQALRRLPNLKPHEQEIVTQLAHRIVNKILHAPTVSLKSRAAKGDHVTYEDAVCQLFALEQRSDAETITHE